MEDAEYMYLTCKQSEKKREESARERMMEDAEYMYLTCKQWGLFCGLELLCALSTLSLRLCVP